MDPYLEACLGDVHSSLVLYIRDFIQGHLPRDLRARVQERVFVANPHDPERDIYPDVRIVEQSRGSVGTATKRAIFTAEPIVVDAEDEPITETYIEIIDIGSGRHVVTMIEVLSPANKRPGDGQNKYLQKQRKTLAGKVSLVEIDLLRAGSTVVSIPLSRIPLSHLTTYRAIVRRGWQNWKAEIYAVPLRERLPTIKIPLREKDADVPLDLQAVLEKANDNGAYENEPDDELEPDPPLGKDDATWMDALLREKGLRQRTATKPARRKKRKT
jgi:hypothetical protein